jgi:hypothetical protein
MARTTAKAPNKIDRAGLLDVQIKDLTRELDALKEELREDYQKGTFAGDLFMLTITPQKKTEVRDKAFSKLGVRRQLELSKPDKALCKKLMTPAERKLCLKVDPGTPRVELKKIGKIDDDK